MNDWLDVMLGEIDRKKQETEEDEQESRRRREETRPDANAGSERKPADRAQSK